MTKAIVYNENMICGIDEVGRGPWAGPLVMGAVVLGGAKIEGLTDSKKLSKKRREELNQEIMEKAAGVGLGWVQASEIDTLGLAPALELACRRAVEALELAYDGGYSEIIIDGTVNFLKDTGKGAYVTTMKKADLLVPSVSAASIVAKVARDQWMTEQDALYPGYKFASHVGYGTAVHRAAIEKLGVTPLHRLSFAPLHKYATQHSHSALDAESSDTIAKKSLFLSKKKQKDLFLPMKEAKDRRLGYASHETTREIGNASETAAAEELVRRGHEIIDRNWKTKYCEIDIVSRKGDTLYFTEVKHRKNTKAGDGLAAITPKKINQMKFAARFYAHTNKLEDTDLRLMAIATTSEIAEVVSLVEIR